mmetsp:Transcript_25565/g.55897  ORF Transcript_25565/g.55897 Transcript_25565/m.55897 type:complete len:473 (-) Transcript_25565:110-1528(-)
MPRFVAPRVVFLQLLATAASIVPTVAMTDLTWIPKSACPISGVHHPITFANETHGFLLTGSTYESTTSSEFYMYDESTDTWTDLTASSEESAFPGPARSFGYGVVLAESRSTKAYLGFGAAADGRRLADLWEFDMSTHEWRQLPDCPGLGRRHPAMNAVRNSINDKWEIHVGLGDTYTDQGGFSNLNDWWVYDVETFAWRQGPDLPSTTRHHPFHFAINGMSYAGLGHSNSRIERDWFVLGSSADEFQQEPSFASYEVIDADNGMPSVLSDGPVTTEARVAGTQFSIELPLANAVNEGASTLSGSLGFVLSGDGDDHGTMSTGEFHAFYPSGNVLMDGPDGPTSSWWRRLPPHPGKSRWAPGSFVMRGTARAYFTSGYDRADQVLYNDLWMMDLSPLFDSVTRDGPENGIVVDSSGPVVDGNVEYGTGVKPNRDALSVDNLDEDATSGVSRLDMQIYIGIGCIVSVFLPSLF